MESYGTIGSFYDDAEAAVASLTADRCEDTFVSMPIGMQEQDASSSIDKLDALLRSLADE